MENHYQLNDEELARQLEECTLDPTLFSHEAHLRLAWIHIQRHGLSQAETNLCDQIQCYAIALGAKDKFHKTITIAAIKAVNHFVRRAHSSGFAELIEEFPRLKTDFMDLINTHYKEDIFKNSKARTEFIEPDLLSFD